MVNGSRDIGLSRAEALRADLYGPSPAKSALEWPLSADSDGEHLYRPGGDGALHWRLRPQSPQHRRSIPTPGHPRVDRAGTRDRRVRDPNDPDPASGHQHKLTANLLKKTSPGWQKVSAGRR